jgi:hypothetical protein
MGSMGVLFLTKKVGGKSGFPVDTSICEVCYISQFLTDFDRLR